MITSGKRTHCKGLTVQKFGSSDNRKRLCQMETYMCLLLPLFRAKEQKALGTYCDHALSIVCPLDYLHFRILLQNRLMNFYETWCGWSTQGPGPCFLARSAKRLVQGGAKIGQGSRSANTSSDRKATTTTEPGPLVSFLVRLVKAKVNQQTHTIY